MLIHTRSQKEQQIIEPVIVCPQDPDYTLPIAIVDPNSLTENDEELIQAMAQYRPNCKLKAGDLVMLTEVPLHMRQRRVVIPRFWKVRFVVTRWAYELMAVAWQHGGNLGMDRAVSLLDRHNMHSEEYRKPVVFAHGYPHGIYANSASWLPVRCLRKAPFREVNAPWRDIVEEAGSNFYGYDPERIPAAFSFSLSPDDYSGGHNIGRPFVHEEATTHAAASAGLEEHMMVPIILGKKAAAIPLDPDQLEEP